MVKTRSGRIYGDGSTNEAQKRLQALENYFKRLLPDEIWLMISGNLNDPKDLINFSYAFPFLQKYLQEKLITAKFQVVLQQLLKTVYKDLDYEQRIKHLAKLRGVSKSWKYGVDKILEMDTGYKEILNFSPSCYLINIAAGSTGFFLPQQFLEHFSETHQAQGINPVCTRTLMISKEIPEVANEQIEMEEFTAVREILEHYGQHVWHLGLQSGRTLTFQQFLWMQGFVRLTPNLKSLHVDIRCQGFTEEQLEQLMFPKLDGLELITIRRLGYMEPVFKSLIGNNSHITQFEVEYCHDLTGTVAENLTHLKELLIKEPCEELAFFELDNPQVNWPLEKLSIKFYDARLKEPEQVFDIITRKWGSTLKILWLQIGHVSPNFTNFEELSMPQHHPSHYPELHLPHLEQLQLTFITYSASWSFITPMAQTLKILELRYLAEYGPKYWQPANYSQVDEWTKALRNPLKADLIWNTFPKLDTFQCQDLGEFVHKAKGARGKRMEVYRRAQWRLI